jgi:hypothetical protein
LKSGVGCNSNISVEIKLNSIGDDIKCQILRSKSNSRGWQDGKLRINTQIFEQRIYKNSENKEIEVDVNVFLEFCPDQPVEPESPLDDLRQQTYQNNQ